MNTRAEGRAPVVLARPRLCADGAGGQRGGGLCLEVHGLPSLPPTAVLLCVWQ